ncbi:glycosyltransferase [Pelagibacteraceae bacterium]|nr:glycosyltransferase [Pelagibacteraceae bacterium]
MKFLLVAYNDSDGVGQTAVNLNSTLNNLGYKSKLILLNKTVNSKDIFKIRRSFIKRVFFYFFEFFKKRYSDLFSFGNSTVNFKDLEKHTNEADIIIVYTLHKILTLNMLAKLYDQKKVVYIRPLDMELATGGCHVNFLYESGVECKKYITGCGRCPKLNKLNLFDISKKIFKDKKKFMDKYKPTILLENKFTKKIYDNSPISKNAKNEVVYLTVRENRKQIINKKQARDMFQLKEHEKILLFGTYNFDAPHKGGRILGEILNLFVDYCNQKDRNLLKKNKVKLVTFGRKQSFKLNISQISWLHLNEIKSDKELNALYRLSDVFLSPSTGCNAPSTIRESTINNIPTIAFDNGEASEAIVNKVNGFLIPKFDKNKFAQAIFNTIFDKNLKDDKEWNNLLKLRYNSKTEAEMIINKALSDFKK